MSGGWEIVLDVLAAICLLGASFLSLAAGIGLTRFPDLLARMHAATKPQVLGVILMMLGLGLRLRNGPIIWMLVLVAMFQLLTSPVSAHMVARAGYRTGKVRHDLLVVDELTRDLEAARRQIRADAAEQDRRAAEEDRRVAEQDRRVAEQERQVTEQAAGLAAQAPDHRAGQAEDPAGHDSDPAGHDSDPAGQSQGPDPSPS